MSKKIALLIGVSEYGEGIPPLSSALNDVEAMQRVLQNPNLGGFAQVERLLNPDAIAMRKAIQKLFRDGGKDDLVLFFFSGHGITNDQDHLYLATRNTAKDDFEATAVDASFIQGQSNNCYARRQVLILDACYSGAIAQGWRTKSVGVDIKKQLGAEGRVVLTSSSATQTSFEQEGATLSLYTQYLVEGIETGAADKDGDGNIHAHELHAYAKAKVQTVKPKMTPDIILDKEGYNILLAYAPRNPEAEYRKLVEQYAQNGELDWATFLVLKPKRKTFGLTDEKAEQIENEVLEPFRRRWANLESYKQAFAKAVEQKYPLHEHTLKKLKDYQQDILGLSDEDVASIELEITERLQRSREPKNDDLSSEKGLDYTRLRDLLKAGKWKEADQETLGVMLKATDIEENGWLSIKSIENFPCTDLRTIDQLWVKYSNGRFGFSVQKRIWESVGKDYDKFCDRVSWRKNEKVVKEKWFVFKQQETMKERWLNSNQLTYTISACEGHLPYEGSRGMEEVWSGRGMMIFWSGDYIFSRVQTCKL